MIVREINWRKKNLVEQELEALMPAMLDQAFQEKL